jgi:hypothetical protein
LRPTSIPPHPFFEALRFGLRRIQLVEPRKRRARRDLRQPVADEHRVDAHTVPSDDVGDATARPTSVDFGFQANPTTQHEAGETLTRGVGDDGWNLDAEQPDMTDVFDIDRVAADDCADQNRLGYLDGRRGRCRDGHGRGEHWKQYLHRDLLRQ